MRCPDGWGDRGDMALETNGKCDQDLKTIKIIALTSCIVCGLNMFFIFWMISSRLSKYKLQNPQILSPIFLGIASIGAIIYAILKIIDPIKNVLGGDILSTCINAIYWSFLLFGLMEILKIFRFYFIGATRAMPANARNRMNSVVNKYENYKVFVSIFAVFIYISPLIIFLDSEFVDYVVFFGGFFCLASAVIYTW